MQEEHEMKMIHRILKKNNLGSKIEPPPPPPPPLR